jgi:hypothetical protein
LICSTNNQMIVFHAHIDNSFPEVQVVIHLVKAVVDADLVFLVENSFNVCPRNLSINDVAKNYSSTASSSGNCCAIMAPRKT